MTPVHRQLGSQMKYQDLRDFLQQLEKLGELKRLAVGIETQIATLTDYRKSLIHECVTGQRRVTEEDLRRAGAARSACAVEQAS